MAIECDVLVIGAGPAGCAAARAAALGGAKTILVDKKKQIGDPVLCGEGISGYLLKYMPFRIPKKQFIWNAKGLSFWIDDNKITRSGSEWRGFTINRGEYDRWLAKKARYAGSKILTSAEVKSFNFRANGDVEDVLVETNSLTKIIKPRIVIGADGVGSTTLNLCGRYKPLKGNIARVYSWEVGKLRLIEPYFHQVFVGDFIPGGYAYIIPKSKKQANIGVGSIIPKKDMKEYFNDFINIPYVATQLKNAAFLSERSKDAVWGPLGEETLFNNVILAGDSANQNLKPFVEGNIPAIVGGDIAGKVAIGFMNGKSCTNEEYQSMFIKKMSPASETSLTLEKTIRELFLDKPTRASPYIYIGLVCQVIGPHEIKHLAKKSKSHIRKIVLSRLSNDEV